jgi:cytochrome P450
MVIVAVDAVHHRPDLYPEPFTFKPERFTDGVCFALQQSDSADTGAQRRLPSGMRWRSSRSRRAPESASA